MALVDAAWSGGLGLRPVLQMSLLPLLALSLTARREAIFRA